ncbi:bone morphogenetic protein 10-like [Haliotis rubra]|uniref:bone morphogenetic protein 10-like n=1 Tax=Haliotis rubra TaxID=36100 RepID=UPI001EE62717|nr:bone morphogenetic protein 10-like [Haliotis rubra]
MRLRLLISEVIRLLLLLPTILRPSVALPFNWSLVSDFNVTGNITLPDGLDGGMDYQYNTLYDDYDSEEDPDDMEDEEVEIEDISLEKLPPPGLASEGAEGNIRDPYRDPPEYMMDLYNRFSVRKPYIHPTSSIVRSFMNINQEDFDFNGTNKVELPGNNTRVHKLVFNITSISRDEEIDYAMLRLFTLVQQDRDAYAGIDRIVSVLQDRGIELGAEDRYKTLSSRHIYGHNSGWEAFDVTSAVRLWAENISYVQILEVRIESVFNVVTDGAMDIDTDPKHRNEPLLIIFSNNKQKRSLREKELHELITHEMDVADEAMFRESVHQHRHSNSTEQLSRFKRSKKNRKNSCRRGLLYVSFQQINWHKWIIAPSGYQAFECVGKCYYPLSDHLTPTKHAVIQMLFHTSRPKEVARACCVPTKLNPISILYLDENKVPTFKWKFEGMQVAECGCR